MFGIRIGLAVAVALVAAALGAQAQDVFVRPDVYSAKGQQMLASYAKGVAVMKSRNPSDVTSWAFQAKIHQDFCEHGWRYFLPWHRMYLYYFERIVRKASGDPAFALPYWNYSDNIAKSYLPEKFRKPADASNALYLDQRACSINGVSCSLAPLPESATPFRNSLCTWKTFSQLQTSPTPPFTATGFGGGNVSLRSYGSVERLPHNAVHNGVGGFMSMPPVAALDPIFWLHHANVDRLWSRWLEMGGGRANPTDTAWLDKEYTFYDENGKAVKMRVSQILKTEQQLKYRYDDEGTGGNIQCPPQPPVLAAAPIAAAQTLGASETGVELRGLRQSATIPVAEAFRGSLRSLLSAGAGEGRDSAHILLRLEEVDIGEDADEYYEVFLNLPAGQEPDPNGPHYVGYVDLFGMRTRQHGHGDHHASEKGSQVFLVTHALRQGESLDHVTITFVPYPRSENGQPLAASASIRIGRLTLFTGDPASQ